MNTIPDATIYLRVPEDKTHPFGLKKVEGHSVFSRPTLLCCGGVTATHQNPAIANGYAKKGLSLVNCLETNGHAGFQTATVTYIQSATLSEEVKATNSGRGSKELFSNFVDEQLLPLFQDADGKRYNIETVKKNFRNINVIAHSYGGLFIQQAGNLLVRKMQEAGFKPQEIDEATQQILIVTAGSVANFMKGDAKFTQINVMHLHDTIMTQYTNNVSIAKSFIDSEDSKKKPLAALRFSYGDSPFEIHHTPDAAEMIISTTKGEPPEKYLPRYNDAKQKESDEYIRQHGAHPIITDEKFHECPTYLNFSFDSYGLILRTMMSTILANGLNNSISNERNPDNFASLPKHNNLLELPQKQEFEFTGDKDFRKIAKAIGYNDRIHHMLGIEASPQAHL